MNLTKHIATGAIAGFVVIGGMQLAGAQEATDDSTTTTVEESTTDDSTTTDPALDGEGCDKDGDGVADEAPTEAENPAAPSPEA